MGLTLSARLGNTLSYFPARLTLASENLRMAQVVEKFRGRELWEIVHGQGEDRRHSCSGLQKRLKPQKMVASRRFPGMVTRSCENLSFPWISPFLFFWEALLVPFLILDMEGTTAHVTIVGMSAVTTAVSFGEKQPNTVHAPNTSHSSP